MLNQKTTLEMKMDAAEAGWNGLYRAAGVCLLLVVGLILVDFALSFGGGDVPVGGLSAVDWFALFERSWFLGLRNLGIFNVINPILTLPLYLALYHLHRKSSPAGAALALIFSALGAAVYAANNQALTMLSLSSQYAAAATEAQKALLETTGTVILAQAEDFTPGTLPGFLLSSISSLMMMAVMLRGRIFGRRTSLAGLAGSAALLIFTVCVTFAPASMDLLMGVAMAGGLLMLAWQIRMVLAMFRLGRSASSQAAHPTAPAGFALQSKGR